MTSTHPPFKLWSDQLEIRQGDAYTTIDCRRVESVYYNEGWMTVRYKVRGEIVLDCTKMESADIKLLLHTLDSQRAHHREREQRRK